MLCGHKHLLVAGALIVLSATIASAQITVTLSPSSASLTAGQSTNFVASISGTNVGGVTWMTLPAVGTLRVTDTTTIMNGTSPTPTFTVSGTYTAPPTVNSPQAVTLITRSLADQNKTASATIFLASTVGIAVTPSSVSLGAGESADFQASIGGTLNTSVNWSINPPVGTIANGVYTAPVVINTLQTVVLIAASLADPSKTAQASITLTGKPTSISVSPTQVTLQSSQSRQFTATVRGGSSIVRWSISPAVGSISPSGLYTPPSTAADGQQISVIATL